MTHIGYDTLQAQLRTYSMEDGGGNKNQGLLHLRYHTERIVGERRPWMTIMVANVTEAFRSEKIDLGTAKFAEHNISALCDNIHGVVNYEEILKKMEATLASCQACVEYNRERAREPEEKLGFAVTKNNAYPMNNPRKKLTITNTDKTLFLRFDKDKVFRAYDEKGNKLDKKYSWLNINTEKIGGTSFRVDKEMIAVNRGDCNYRMEPVWITSFSEKTGKRMKDFLLSIHKFPSDR
jgi:hypothetical protein